MELTEDGLLTEAIFKASRSGGSGGQHVNKVSSKVEVRFNIPASSLFSEDEKNRLISRLSGRLSADNSIRIVSQDTRSQLANKQLVLKKLHAILLNTLKENKPRKATKPKKAAIEKRLREKQLVAQKKIARKKYFD